jgi:hypothetical protein
VDRVAERLPAAVGRLLSRPDFLQAQDRLRVQWLRLPLAKRPPLPLDTLRQTPASKAPGGWQQERHDGVVEFWRAFIEFCDQWQLNGMATWDLPDPCAPQWPRVSLAQDDRDDEARISTPWHFPLLRSDSLGEAATAIYERSVKRRGVDDHGSWETYALFLPLVHWERVLRSRYLEQQKRGFVREMEFLLANLLDVSRDRVQVLRKRIAALRAGNHNSLRGVR